MHLTHTRCRRPRDLSALPPSAPFPSVLQTLACRVRPLEYLDWCRSRIGTRFTVYPLDMPPLVFLADPDDVRAVVTAPLTVLHAGAGAARTAPIFGDRSFLLLEEGDYLIGRNAIRPALGRKAVRQHEEMVAELAARAASAWPLGAPIASYPRLAAVTLAVVLARVFGCQSPTIAAIHRQLLAMLSFAASPVLQEPRLRHLPGWRGTWRLFLARRLEVDGLIAELIAAGRSADGGRGEVLEALLQARRPDGSPMSDRELRDNLVSVIVAGHETTASTLAWAFQLIAHHPRVQARLIEELEAGEGDEYLMATINEVIRHRPVFLFTAPRAVAQPIEIGGWSYHPPAHLLGCTYLMHHDPSLYADPNEFRPERFLDAPASQRSWLPWGGGQKLCPGRHLAVLELRAVLRATLVRRELLPASDALERASWRSALLTPCAGSKVILRRREARAASPRRRSSPRTGGCRVSTTLDLFN